MKKLLNSLYITTQGSYLCKERETLIVKQDRKKVFQLPIHALENIFCFGNVMISPDLMFFCGERNIGITFLTEYGKFQCRVLGPQTGNVLLRRAQYRMADSSAHVAAKLFVAAKIANGRQVVLKHQRNHGENKNLASLEKQLANNMRRLEKQTDIEKIRGIEGDSAARYFANFQQFIMPSQKADFTFSGRNKRPPLDIVNALLSYAYVLLSYEISSSLQAVGLDPYVGFLHADRPGRISLALDMLEEFRAWWCDRFVLSLINRKQAKTKDFTEEASGAIKMTEEFRKRFLVAWQEKKHEELVHPYLNEKIKIGLLPHIQSALFARWLRNDIEIYPPFYAR